MPRVNGYTEDAFKYDAFISYSRKNELFASRLHKDLENYRPPKDISVIRRNLRIFRDKTDFTAGEYREHLSRALRDSAKLIVICSPEARHSQYVNEEVRLFASLHRTEDIIPVLFSGLPNNEINAGQDELMAFPQALMEMVQMPLAVNYMSYQKYGGKANGVNYFDAWYTLLANLFDTSRSDIEQRDRLRKVRFRRLAAGLSSVVVTALSISLVFALMSRDEAKRAEARARLKENEANISRDKAKKSENKAILSERREAKEKKKAIAEKNSAVRSLISSLLSQSESRRVVDDQIGALTWALRAFNEYSKTPSAYQSLAARKEAEVLLALSIQKSINPFGLKEISRAQSHTLEWNGASVAINSKHGFIAVANPGKDQIDLFSLSGKFLRSINCPRCILVDTAVDEIYGATNEGNLYRVGLISGNRARFRLGEGEINCISVSPKGDMVYIASGFESSSWRINGKGLFGKQTFKSESPSLVVAASPDGQYWASANLDGTVYLRSRFGKLIASIPTTPDVVTSISISRTNDLIAVASLNGKIYMIEPKNNGASIARGTLLVAGKAEFPIVEISDHRHGVRAVRISPDGNTIASLDDHGTLLVRKRHQYMLIDGINGDVDNSSDEQSPRFYPSNWLAFTQDGTKLAALQELPAAEGRLLRIWTSIGTGLVPLSKDRGLPSYAEARGRSGPERVVYSKQEFTVVTPGSAKAGRRINAEHTILSAAIDRGNGLVATVGYRDVKLWSSGGRLLTVLPRFSPDGSNSGAEALFLRHGSGLTIGGADGKYLFWSFDPFVAKKAACAWLRPYLQIQSSQSQHLSSVCLRG